MVYSSSWINYSDINYGLYSLPIEANSTFAPVCTFGLDMVETFAFGGGTLIGNKYHTLTYNMTGSGQSMMYRVYDIKTWRKDFETDLPNDYFSFDLTYDETTGNIYGAFQSYVSESGLGLAILDTETLELNPVGTFSQIFYFLAASNDGILYGVGSDGNLYRIDKTNADETFIGCTGIIPQTYAQSEIGRASCRERVSSPV